MDEYLFFLGSNPALSLAELRAALGYEGVRDEGQLISLGRSSLLRASLSPTLADNLLSRLGGSDRVSVVLQQFDHLPEAEEILGALDEIPVKWQLGVSVLSTSQNISGKRLALDIKKAAKAKGSKVAFIVPKGAAGQLNAAQVIFNNLTQEPHADLQILEMADGNFLLTKTIAVQDIQAYELRDTKRPGRDAQVGMLPPKLAQMMLNLALRQLSADEASQTILDPFCGMGTILQEGWLMGHKMVGTDASERMIEYASRNLQWTYGHFRPVKELQPELLVHDIQEPFPQHWAQSFSAVVTEPYLGKPISSPLPYRKAVERQESLTRLYGHFFRHAHGVLKDTGVLLAALPVIKTQDGRKQQRAALSPAFLDSVGRIGYRMIQLAPPELQGRPGTTERNTLLYGRPDAVVERELILFQKL